ncbi:endonuclease/exonuclease/phosphatase family protein [Roseovarius arcticus]|uniref:endonuclease/exonuclease/phosphatase family protein n=1 Tax=Roseovarius arcticus TaxID=2547404 RepID=UPI001BB11542|nr:endonuclease/exonuclease/phosphatase family protein [Roseovarius arcticus]
MDFPRIQIAVVAGIVLVIGLFISGPSRVLIPLLMMAVGFYQAWRVYPYTMLAKPDLELAAGGEESIRILSSNVLMENDRHGDLIDIITKFDPDILLLMETDQIWLEALAPVLGEYSTVVREPRDDHYGMVFATRLDVNEARIVYLTSEDTPSIFAQMQGPNGTKFRFVGLHPRPPVPGESTKERDAQIYYAARFARKADVPLIAAGDFNDVAWSDTSRTFKHVGQYLDPRIGRGFFSSFDAKKFWLRFPIDQVFVTEDVAVVSLERLPFIGSDHFPMATTVRLDSSIADRLNSTPEPISEDEQKLIEDSIVKTRDMLGHSKL